MSNITPLSSASDVLDRLGGTAISARLIGSKPAAVSNWRKAGVFPSDKYVVMQGLLAERGLSAPASLWQMAEKREVAA